MKRSKFEWDWLTSVQLQVGGQEWQETNKALGVCELEHIRRGFRSEVSIRATTTPYSILRSGTVTGVM